MLCSPGRRQVHTRLVEPSVTSMNSGDVYICVSGKSLYHWVGKSANVIEKARVRGIVLYSWGGGGGEKVRGEGGGEGGREEGRGEGRRGRGGGRRGGGRGEGEGGREEGRRGKGLMNSLYHWVGKSAIEKACY